jgi:hypothetical protein
MGRYKTISDHEVLAVARDLFRKRGHNVTTRVGKNPKSEARNPKQIQSTKSQISNQEVSDFGFGDCQPHPSTARPNSRKWWTSCGTGFDLPEGALLLDLCAVCGFVRAQRHEQFVTNRLLARLKAGVV